MDSIICSLDNRSLDSSLQRCKTAVETALVPVEERRPSVSVTSLGTVSSASARVKVPVKPERYALCEGTHRQIVQGTDIARLRCLSVRDGGSANLVEGCVLQVGPRCPRTAGCTVGLPERPVLGLVPVVASGQRNPRQGN